MNNLDWLTKRFNWEDLTLEQQEIVRQQIRNKYKGELDKNETTD